MMQYKLGKTLLFMILGVCYAKASAVELTIYSSAAPGTLKLPTS